MTLSVNITGISELQARVDAIPQKLAAASLQALQQSADAMVSQMKSSCPVDTGFLRDNIMITNQNEFAIQVSSLAYYSIFIEFGTYKMGGQPFFLDAALSNMATPEMILALFTL
jgi:HK97 gp10 family phage protein